MTSPRLALPRLRRRLKGKKGVNRHASPYRLKNYGKRCHSIREGGFCGMASSLRQIIWPEKFKPGHIDKYDGSNNPKEFIQVYHTVIEAEGDDQVNVNYLPTVLFDTRPEPGLSICPKDSSTTGTNYVLYSSGTFRVRMSRTFSSSYAYVRTFSLPHTLPSAKEYC
jgi:hypothetical protein